MPIKEDLFLRMPDMSASNCISALKAVVRRALARQTIGTVTERGFLAPVKTCASKFCLLSVPIYGHRYGETGLKLCMGSMSERFENDGQLRAVRKKQETRNRIDCTWVNHLKAAKQSGCSQSV